MPHNQTFVHDPVPRYPAPVILLQNHRNSKALSVLGVHDLRKPTVPEKDLPQLPGKFGYIWKFRARGDDTLPLIGKTKPSKSWFYDEERLKEPAVAEFQPPKDGGLAAWKFLLGASLLEAVSCSFSMSSGVFRTYYFTHPPFQNITQLAAVGPLSSGFVQILVPFLLKLLRKNPETRKSMTWFGMLICVLASFGASISTEPWQIIGTQGVLFGIGAGCLSAPVMVLMPDWFEKRQSFAWGVVFGTSGIFGSFIPTVHTILLERFGQKITLLVHALSVFSITTIALCCIKSRLPGGLAARKKDSSFSQDYWRNPSFYILAASVLIQATVLNIPGIFFPSFAIDLKYTTTQGAVVLSTFNLSTAGGQILSGIIADLQKSFYLSLFLSTSGSALTILLLWAEAKTLAALLIASSVYGLFAGGYGTLRSRFARAVCEVENEESTLVVFGIYTAVRGAGNVAGGFIGSATLNESIQVEQMEYALKKWIPLVILVGAGMSASAAFGVVQWLLHRFFDTKKTTSRERKIKRTDV